MNIRLRRNDDDDAVLCCKSFWLRTLRNALTLWCVSTNASDPIQKQKKKWPSNFEAVHTFRIEQKDTTKETFIPRTTKIRII